MSAIETIEQIVQLAEDCKLSESFFEKANPFLHHLAVKQGIEDIQALFLALFVERSSSFRSTDLSDIAEILDCRAVSILKYVPQIDELVKNHFLKEKTDYNDRANFFVPKKVIEALSNDVKYERESYQSKDVREFLTRFYEFTHAYYHDELSYSFMCDEVKLLFAENEELKFVQVVKKLDLDFDDEMILTHFCRHLYIHNHDVLETENLTFLLKDDCRKRQLVESLA